MAIVALARVYEMTYSGGVPYLGIYISAANNEGNGWSYEMPASDTPMLTMLPDLIDWIKGHVENDLGQEVGVLDTIRLFYPADTTG